MPILSSEWKVIPLLKLEKIIKTERALIYYNSEKSELNGKRRLKIHNQK